MDKNEGNTTKETAKNVMAENLLECARCGLDHAQIKFMPFTNPPEVASHWAMCPELNEPILMSLVRNEDTAVDKNVARNVIRYMAKDAIMVQNACNMSGVAIELGNYMPKLREALSALGECTDTDAINKHPIVQMFASALHYHSGMGMSNPGAYSKAYSACCDLASEDNSNKGE